MESDETKIEEQDVEQVVDTSAEVDESTQEVPPVGSDYKTKQSFFGKIAKTFFSNDDTGDADDVADDEESDVEEFVLTDEIKEAAKAAGWDDDRIAKYAKEDPDVLRLLSAQYAYEPDIPSEPANEPKKEEQERLGKIELSQKALEEMKEQYGDEVVNDVISPLVEKLNKVVEVLEAQAGQSQAAQQAVSSVVMAEREKGFQEKLDMLDEQFPVFGKWENVPRDKTGQVDVKSPQFKARAEVWVTAQSLEKAGYDWGSALDNAIAMYKGKHLESAVKSKVIRDLNGRKKLFTAQPTHKKTKPVKLEGKQAAIQAVKEAAQKAGVTF